MAEELGRQMLQMHFGPKSQSSRRMKGTMTPRRLFEPDRLSRKLDEIQEDIYRKIKEKFGNEFPEEVYVGDDELTMDKFEVVIKEAIESNIHYHRFEKDPWNMEAILQRVYNSFANEESRVYKEDKFMKALNKLFIKFYRERGLNSLQEPFMVTYGVGREQLGTALNKEKTS